MENDDHLQAQRLVRQLPLSERRRILASQAEEMKSHYEETADKRLEWQAGDIMDEDTAAQGPTSVFGNDIHE